MTINEYLDSGFKLMTNENATKYNFFGIDALKQTTDTLKNQYGIRELYYTANTVLTIEQLIQEVILNCFYINTYTWNTLYKSINMTYEPFERTNITENNKETNSGTDTVNGTNGNTTSTTVTPATTTTKSERTFDDATFNDVEKNTNSGTETSSGTSSSTDSHNTLHGHIIDKTHSISGKDNIDFESIIDSERKIAMFSFIGQIAETIANYISLTSYNFDDTYEPLYNLT